MPDTFSTQLDSPSQAAGISFGRVAAGVDAAPAQLTAGAPRADFSQLAAVNKGNWDVLDTLLGGIAKPALQRYQTDLALDGTMRALQGESAKDIQDNNLFGNVFGDSASVQAARSVEVQNAAMGMSNKIMTSMDDLKKMPPDAFRTWYKQQIDGAQTGDTSSDALISHTLLQQMPAVMDMHTKANYEYNQQQAMNANLDQVASASKSYEATFQAAKEGRISSDLVDQQRNNFVSTVLGPQGIDDSNRGPFLAQGYQRAIAQNDWATADLYEKSGVFDHFLTPEQVNTLHDNRFAREQQQLARDPRAMQALTTEAGFDNSITANPFKYNSMADLDKAMDEVNRQYSLDTGSAMPLIGNGKREGFQNKWLDAMDRANRMRDKAFSDAADLAHQKMAYGQAIVSGNLQSIQGAGVGEDVKAQWDREYIAGLKTPDDWKQAMFTLGRAAASGAVNGELKQQWTRTLDPLFTSGKLVGDPNMTVGTLAQVRQMLSTPYGRTGLSATLGPDMATKVEDMAVLGDGVTDAKQLQDIAETVQLKHMQAPSFDDVNKVGQSITASFPGVVGRMFGAVGWTGQQRISDENAQSLANMLAPKVALLRARNNGMSVEDATQTALGQYVKDADFIRGNGSKGGAFATSPANTAGAPTLFSAVQTVLKGKGLTQNTDDYQDAIHDVAVKKQAAIPNFKDYQVIGLTQLGGYAGQKAVIVKYQNPDNPMQQISVPITAGEVAFEYQRGSADRTAKRVKRETPTGAVSNYAQGIQGTTVPSTGYTPN